MPWDEIQFLLKQFVAPITQKRLNQILVELKWKDPCRVSSVHKLPTFNEMMPRLVCLPRCFGFVNEFTTLNPSLFSRPGRVTATKYGNSKTIKSIIHSREQRGVHRLEVCETFLTALVAGEI